MHFDTGAERIFAVLSDPGTYADWVVGARSVEAADGTWPARGSTFRHTQGMWPLVLSDTTSVVSSDPPRRLELEARVRPLLVVRVVLELEPEDGGTRVVMDERPIGGLLELPGRLPPWTELTKLRNLESLRRLRALAQRRLASNP
jgi:hypothetical protein